ncbi:MAG: EF-P lysine aminoacylase GenX [Myxococcales bacterium]|nr:EF-P lysine aminoacylase GenX [Myxococcales bacterium]
MAAHEIARLDAPTASGRTRREVLRLRQRILATLRAWLDAEDFFAAEVPLLIRGACPDVYLASFVVPGGGYLTTSTEYLIKRLVAGGFERVYTLAPNFRAGEVSPRHGPEFTMLEWSRAGADLARIERDAEALVRASLAAIAPGATAVTWGGHTVDVAGPWERLTVRDALRRHLGADVDATFSLASLRAGIDAAGLRAGPGLADTARDAMSLLMGHLQPHLGTTRPTFLTAWPAFETSSAARASDAVAERSELFIAGMELADGFPSLLDADQQRATFAEQLEDRRAAGLPGVDLDERYLAALDGGLPKSAGMALGVDRLVMVLTGTDDIRDVQTFGWDER